MSSRKKRPPGVATQPVDHHPTPAVAYSGNLGRANLGKRGIMLGFALLLLGTACAFDQGVDRGFDAPKRLLLFVGTLIALVGAAAMPALPIRWKLSWRAHGSVVLLAVAIVFALISTLAAQASIDWSELRYYLALLLILPIVAMTPWQDAEIRILWAIAGVAIMVNVVISGLQHACMPSPLAVGLLGGRFDAGALLGNEGLVSLGAALAIPAWLAFAMSRSGWRRTAMFLACLLCVVVMIWNRQLTSVIAAASGLMAVLILRGRRTRWLYVLAGVSMLAVLTLAIPITRAPVLKHLNLTTVANWQTKTTYRIGASAAALEMIAERPLLGHGPGRYARDSQRFRLRAAERLRARLEMPPNANAFVYAHQDYLQWAAEFGLPSLLAGLAALLWLLWRLATKAWQESDAEPLALCGVLITAMVMSLAWFPMHVPFLAALIALAMGRSWQLTQATAPNQ